MECRASDLLDFILFHVLGRCLDGDALGSTVSPHVQRPAAAGGRALVRVGGRRVQDLAPDGLRSILTHGRHLGSAIQFAERQRHAQASLELGPDRSARAVPPLSELLEAGSATRGMRYLEMLVFHGVPSPVSGVPLAPGQSEIAREAQSVGAHSSNWGSPVSGVPLAPGQSETAR